MEQTLRRVVVTGLGAITPVGNTVEEMWANLKAGVHGIAPITLFDTTDYKTKIGAEVKNFDPRAYMDKTDVLRSDAYAQYGVAAACQALAYLTGGEAGELMYNAIGTFPTNQAKLDSMADFQNGVMKDLKDYLVANDYTRPRQAKYPRLKDAYGEVLSYMRNMNIVSNYDLEAKVREEMRDVDNARA